MAFPLCVERVVAPFSPERPLVGQQQNMASSSRCMSSRPERDNRSRSLGKDFAWSAAPGKLARVLAAVRFKIGKQRVGLDETRLMLLSDLDSL